MPNTELLEQICEHCGPSYCTARKIIEFRGKIPQDCTHIQEEHSHCPNLKYVAKNINDRVILQFKCIEELKWIKGQELHREVSWDEAGMMWVDEGFAKVFADVYSRGERDIYFFFKSGTVPERKKYSKPIIVDEDPVLSSSPAYASEVYSDTRPNVAGPALAMA